MHPNQFIQPGKIEPADAGTLRAIATDIEDEPDRAYGKLTAERLRLLADELDDPIYAGVRASLDYALANVPDGCAVEVEFRFVPESEASADALTPEQAAPLFAAAAAIATNGESDVIPGAK